MTSKKVKKIQYVNYFNTLYNIDYIDAIYTNFGNCYMIYNGQEKNLSINTDYLDDLENIFKKSDFYHLLFGNHIKAFIRKNKVLEFDINTITIMSGNNSDYKVHNLRLSYMYYFYPLMLKQSQNFF